MSNIKTVLIFTSRFDFIKHFEHHCAHFSQNFLLSVIFCGNDLTASLKKGCYAASSTQKANQGIGKLCQLCPFLSSLFYSTEGEAHREKV
jgi:hypothetical protein